MSYIVRTSRDPMASSAPLLPMSRYDYDHSHSRVLDGRRKWAQALADNAPPPEPWWLRLYRAARRIVW